MFFKQIRQNAARSRRDNGLFFGSLVTAIVAFYTLLSLGEQDVMQFLATIESDAVGKLMRMLPVVYAVSLFFVFFLVYFACRYQTDSRRRELGLYLMLGMKRSRLFGMLFCETLWSSMLALLAGLPAALLLTEGISLATARIVGLGIIGHRFSFSPEALWWTVCGFVFVQLLSMLVICAGLGKAEPAEFFRAGDVKRQEVSSGAQSTAFLCLGTVFLLLAYYLGIVRLQALELGVMIATVLFGIAGTFLLYRGLGGFLGRRIRRKSPDAAGLWTFTARQVQENVLSQHKPLAVASLLLVLALSCISFGISMGVGGSVSGRSVDFSLFGEERQIDSCLNRDDIRGLVGESYPLYLSHVKDGSVFDTGGLKAALSGIGGAGNIIENCSFDYVIAESSYNDILEHLGKEKLDLSGGKAALYSSLIGKNEPGTKLQEALDGRVSVGIGGKDYELLPALCCDNIVADRAITLYLGLIVPDALYAQLAKTPEAYCRNVQLRGDVVEKMGLMQAIQNMDALLAGTGVTYDSYLGGIGRNLFYAVAAGYLTIYLGVLFWLIANTVIGLKYLIGQRRTGRRYEILAMLGADMPSLQRSVRKQISVYFALVLAAALVSSAAAIAAMFTSFARLPAGASMGKAAALSAAALLAFAALETFYIRIVKQTAGRELGRLLAGELSHGRRMF